jgi:starvation-inducible DNA-binding protein
MIRDLVARARRRSRAPRARPSRWSTRPTTSRPADLLTQRMQIHEKNAWMLRSLLENA